MRMARHQRNDATSIHLHPLNPRLRVSLAEMLACAGLLDGKFGALSFDPEFQAIRLAVRDPCSRGSPGMRLDMRRAQYQQPLEPRTQAGTFASPAGIHCATSSRTELMTQFAAACILPVVQLHLHLHLPCRQRYAMLPCCYAANPRCEMTETRTSEAASLTSACLDV